MTSTTVHSGLDRAARGRGARRIGTRGFSLVEVLIAVFVLSLGVLGLASIFPVVLREQRDAGERTEASIAADSIESLLRSNIELNRSGNGVGWGIFQDDTGSQGSPATNGQGWSPKGAWGVPVATGGDPSSINSRMVVNPATGLLRFLSNNGSGPNLDPFGDDVLFPLSSRLSPGAFLRGASPRTEWMVAARRVITQFNVNNGKPIPTDLDEVEIAVFVRPIDRAIQVPRRDRPRKPDWAVYGRAISLSDVILASEIKAAGGMPAINAAEARVPVAINRQTGLPTGNGVGDYAALFVADLDTYDFDDTNTATNDNRDRIRVDLAQNDPKMRGLTQIGQRIVDGRGNVYTVRGVDPSDRTILLIDPPVPATVLRSDQISPIVASPVVPLTVEVFRVRP